MAKTKEADDSLTTAANGYSGISVNTTGHTYANSVVGSNGPFIYTAGTGVSNPWATQASVATAGKMTLIGDDADLIINGVSIMKILQERLAVMVPNPKLESEWTELKELGDRYRELEEKIQSKMRTFDALKRYNPS